MRICYFGDFDPNYARNRVIIKGLKENGVEVLLCNNQSKGIWKFLNLIKKLRDLRNNYDLLIVGYSDSRLPVLLARFFSNKPLVWDAFYSLYDSWVFDRGLVNPRNLRARYYWFLDWLSCKLSDRILLDTNAHIDYFVTTYKIKRSKFIKALIGADQSIFYPI